MSIVVTTRGAAVVPTFKEVEHTLAGFLDGHENEGPSAGEPSLLGRKLAAENGWTEPVAVAGTEGEQGGEQA